MGVDRLQQKGPEGVGWPLRPLRWVGYRLRPRSGWLTLLLLGGLALLPAHAFREAGWVHLGQAHFAPEWLGPVAVLWLWLIWPPWGSRSRGGRRWQYRIVVGAAELWIWGSLLSFGALLISQLLVGWLPTPGAVWRATLSGEWAELAWQGLADLSRLGLRMRLWWEGASGGGAAQDDLIFLALVSCLLYLMPALSSWLVLRTGRGLLGALPCLWLEGAILYYSSGSRLGLVVAVGLALLLHLWLHQRALFARWSAQGIDYSPDLAVDRGFAAANILLLLLTLAGVMPNLYLTPLVRRAYEVMAPVDQGLVAIGERLFPDLQAGFRGRYGGSGLGGLPNSFLLGSGSELGQQVVMRLRTNEAGELPTGHYMRGGTLTLYDGRGWDNPVGEQARLEPNQSWTGDAYAGRAPLLQSLFLNVNTPVLFGAPEPLEVTVPVRAEVRGAGDLVALWAVERSYTVLSSVPAATEAELAAAAGWAGEAGEQGTLLPESYQMHLELPDTVTERTRELAAALTAGRDGPYARAQAIEAHLRTLTYDLDIAPPPPAVTDVADYFLFDLQRGYCDYYTTAFVVLARLAGLPARFATGYAVGGWDPESREWAITEAEAHSWPEVYFVDYGWIPFEPTAGRPALVRRGRTSLPSPLPLPATTAADAAQTAAPAESWSWQVWVWLLPLGLLTWLLGGWLWRWRIAREDPWLALLWWGRRLGRPVAVGETDLEYGREFSSHLMRRVTDGERLRRAARDVMTLSIETSRAHYGPLDVRSASALQAARRWPLLRASLWRIWVGGLLPRLDGRPVQVDRDGPRP